MYGSKEDQLHVDEMLASFQGSYAYRPGMRTRLYLVAMGFVVDGITYKGSKHIANCVTGQNLNDSTVMQIQV